MRSKTQLVKPAHSSLTQRHGGKSCDRTQTPARGTDRHVLGRKGQSSAADCLRVNLAAVVMLNQPSTAATAVRRMVFRHCFLSVTCVGNVFLWSAVFLPHCPLRLLERCLPHHRCAQTCSRRLRGSFSPADHAWERPGPEMPPCLWSWKGHLRSPAWFPARSVTTMWPVASSALGGKHTRKRKKEKILSFRSLPNN